MTWNAGAEKIKGYSHARHYRAAEGARALRESERQLRLLIAGVTDYALYMLDPNGLITS